MNNNQPLSTEQAPSDNGASVLVTLRNLMPSRPMRLDEGLLVAERQADRLLSLRGGRTVPVPADIVSGLPRIIIDHDPELTSQAASGASDWDRHRRSWVILINPDEPETRQRFTVLHEYKHIIDHYHPGLAGWLPRTLYGLAPAEYIAEYFAGCVLMPARAVKTAFYDGIQNSGDLAQLFDVSVRAMQVRLEQLGLAAAPAAEQPKPVIRRYRLQPRPQRYHRPLSRSILCVTAKEYAR